MLKLISLFFLGSLMMPSTGFAYFWEKTHEQKETEAYSSEDYVESQKYFELAIAENPSARNYYGQGAALYKQQEHKKALEAFERANRSALAAGQIDLQATILFAMANTYFHLGKFKRAAQLYEGALVIKPDDMPAQENLKKALELAKFELSEKEIKEKELDNALGLDDEGIVGDLLRDSLEGLNDFELSANEDLNDFNLDASQMENLNFDNKESAIDVLKRSFESLRSDDEKKNIATLEEKHKAIEKEIARLTQLEETKETAIENDKIETALAEEETIETPAPKDTHSQEPQEEPKAEETISEENERRSDPKRDEEKSKEMPSGEKDQKDETKSDEPRTDKEESSKNSPEEEAPPSNELMKWIKENLKRHQSKNPIQEKAMEELLKRSKAARDFMKKLQESMPENSSEDLPEEKMKELEKDLEKMSPEDRKSLEDLVKKRMPQSKSEKSTDGMDTEKEAEPMKTKGADGADGKELGEGLDPEKAAELMKSMGPEQLKELMKHAKGADGADGKELGEGLDPKKAAELMKSMDPEQLKELMKHAKGADGADGKELGEGLDPKKSL